MEKNYVKATIEGLKSSSSTQIQETLIEIRSKITINDYGIKIFRDCGGYEYLLPHLRKPNERILDLTLSILGNCCLEEESSLAVGKLNSFGPIITILKTVRRDSIVGRACRLIGNLAQKNSNAEALHNHGAVPALVTLIEHRDRNTSYPTLTMAVRAIRQLWMLTEKREEMLSLNAVHCVAVLMKTECESACLIESSNSMNGGGLRQSQEELITGILKCLGNFTTHCTSQCAKQIKDVSQGYQCLVALTKTYESLALKCLMNLCFLSENRPLLGAAGFVECLINILKKISVISLWPEGAAHALAQLSSESVNRSRLRHAHGVPLLLKAARRSQLALHALLHYVFDDNSFQLLIKEGLINLLADELQQYVATMENQHRYLKPIQTDNAKTKQITEEPSTSTDVTPRAEKPVSEETGASQLTSENADELRVVIERDNMVVAFIDLLDSDASDSQSDNENSPSRRKCLKRAHSRSPKSLKTKSKPIKVASKAGVYWEPKSPECSNSQPRSALSPARFDSNPVLPFNALNQASFGPEFKRSRWDGSPESGLGTGEGSSSTSPYWTEYQWSPASSSPQSPVIVIESSDSEMSGRYSPVCSETETEGAVAVDLAPNSPVVEFDPAQVAYQLDDLIVNDDDTTEDDSGSDEGGVTESYSKSSRVACVLYLLFRATRQESVSNQALELLAAGGCVTPLLDYVERSRYPLGRGAKILVKVSNNALCLMSILKHRLVLRLYNMSVTSKHPLTKCQQCKQIVRLSLKLLSQLSILAESSYGIGEISYQLLKGNDSVKKTLCLTLPFIVKNVKSLKKYFIDYHALNLLFEMIAESKADIQECVVALSKLATNIQIKDPKSLENRFKEYNIFVSYDPILDNLSPEEIVTFELDDSSTVRANRVFLCQNSDVFSAMLMGCFKESVESCVRIQNVSKKGLEYLLTLLDSGLHNSKCDVQVFPMAEDLETNLEVLLLADRFLFDKLKDVLSSAIVQFYFQPQLADKMYAWSLSEGMGLMCVESVAYVLTGTMRDTTRTLTFNNILNMKYKEQWLDDIKSIILRQLVK